MREHIRGGASDADLIGLLQNLWRHRTDRYSEERGKDEGAEKTPKSRIEMYRMGG